MFYRIWNFTTVKLHTYHLNLAYDKKHVSYLWWYNIRLGQMRWITIHYTLWMMYGRRIVGVLNAWQDATVAAAAAIGDRHPTDPSQVPACQTVFAIHHSLIPGPACQRVAAATRAGRRAGDAYRHGRRPAPNLAVIWPARPCWLVDARGGASAHDKSITLANDLWTLAPSHRASSRSFTRPETGRCSLARIGSFLDHTRCKAFAVFTACS